MFMVLVFLISCSYFSLQMKLEKSEEVRRKLNEMVGSTVISSAEGSADVDDVELSPKSHLVEQLDFEFGGKFKYTTNVCIFFSFIFSIYFQQFVFSYPQMNLDRYYLNGRIKISRDDVGILMVSSHSFCFISTKSHDKF